jgi:uncharacterized protein
MRTALKNIEQLAILLWATDPAQPQLCATPFSVAASAAAMDAQVEVYFSARSVLLGAPGIAQGVFPGEDRQRSTAEFMQHARDQGVKFYACGASLLAAGLTLEVCAPWFDGAAGASSVSSRALDAGWRVLVF